jgi:hypothetical protein
MKIGPEQVRELMEAGEPDSSLVLYQGRPEVVSAADLEAGRYPGALTVASQRDLLDLRGRHDLSPRDIEELAAQLDSAVSRLGG